MTHVYNDTFFDYIDQGARSSAQALTGLLSDWIKPQSVLDLGCGRGVWLDEWQRNGATDVLGVDGDYVAAIGVCHCRKCRVWAGTITGYFMASPAAVQVEGPVKTYASTPFATRAFCEICGTNISLRNNGEIDDY